MLSHTLSPLKILPLALLMLLMLRGAIFSEERTLVGEPFIYLLAAGQSNMDRANGSFTHDGIKYDFYRQADFGTESTPQVQILNSYNNTFETWDLNVASQSEFIGLNRQVYSFQGSTIAFHAAKEIALATGKTVRVIASAQGGRAISFWGAQLDGSAFNKSALGWQRILQQKAFVPRLDGVLWHQLESNALDTALEYETALSQLMAQVRSEFASPDILWLAGESTIDGHGRGALEGLRAMDANTSTYPNFELVRRPLNATRYSIPSQGIHFDDNGVAYYGIAYGERFLNRFMVTPSLTLRQNEDESFTTTVTGASLDFSFDGRTWFGGRDQREQSWSPRKCFFRLIPLEQE